MKNIKKYLIWFSYKIDALNGYAGRLASLLVLVVVVISAGNALVRYLFDYSSNGWLEIQWYLFSGVFLLGAGDALRQGDHIRIDILSQRLSRNMQKRIYLLGTLVFLLPMAGLVIVLSWPEVMKSFLHHEMSPNAGGLVRWPVKMLVPIGFMLLWLQGVAECIKTLFVSEPT